MLFRSYLENNKLILAARWKATGERPPAPSTGARRITLFRLTLQVRAHLKDKRDPKPTLQKINAEFWNTITNVNHIALGLFGYFVCLQMKLEKRFQLAYLSLVVIGVGSWMFHMTLLYEYQVRSPFFFRRSASASTSFLFPILFDRTYTAKTTFSRFDSHI